MIQTLILVPILDFFPEKTWAIDKEKAPAKAEASSNSTSSSLSPEEEALLSQGKFQEIVDSLAPKLSDLEASKLKLLGRAYSGLKNSAAAIKTLSLVLGKNPKDAEASTLIGLELMSQGKDREAMISFREALKNDPKFEPGYFAIEKIYIKKKNKYELRMLYSDMIELLGEQPNYVSRLCEIYTSSGLFEDAKKTCRRGIALSKDDPKSYLSLAMTLRDTGEKEEAIKLFRQTADDFKKSDEAQLVFAQFLDGEKNFIESNKYYKNATEANPNSLRGWVGLGLSSLELQKYQITLEALTTACKLDRRAIKEVRRAMGILRTMKEEKWIEKFSLLAEKCGLPTYDSKSTK